MTNKPICVLILHTGFKSLVRKEPFNNVHKLLQTIILHTFYKCKLYFTWNLKPEKRRISTFYYILRVTLSVLKHVISILIEQYRRFHRILEFDSFKGSVLSFVNKSLFFFTITHLANNLTHNRDCERLPTFTGPKIILL